LGGVVAVSPPAQLGTAEEGLGQSRGTIAGPPLTTAARPSMVVGEGRDGTKLGRGGRADDGIAVDVDADSGTQGLVKRTPGPRHDGSCQQVLAPPQLSDAMAVAVTGAGAAGLTCPPLTPLSVLSPPVPRGGRSGSDSCSGPGG
ncbi:unnamed protein product, partial [Discosporangium mesarthrocarpum]